MNENNKPDDMEVEVEVSSKGLSLKAKSTGILCLLAISISGLVFVAYLFATKDNGMLMAPMMFLLFITYQLINLIHALFKTGIYIDVGKG